MFFEKELFYYKLTVASGIRKGLLLVSFVAVENYCRGMLKKSFSFAQTFFIAIQSDSFLPSAALRTTLNLLFAKNTAVLLMFA